MSSFSVVSLIAMVPDSECRMPTLIVSESACAAVVAESMAMPANALFQSFIDISLGDREGCQKLSDRPTEPVTKFSSGLPGMASLRVK